MRASPIARSTTATSRPRFAGADLVVRERFRFPRWSCTPVECYGVVADWSAAEGSLTAWANFQGPFTLHSVAAAALGLPGSKLRLITPPDSGGSFGIKSAVFAYVVLMGLASRKLGVPVRWTEDRLEHLAASSSVDRARRRERRGRRSPPTASSLGAAVRRDRGRRRVRARARAGDALPDARLARGRVPRAERGGPQPRRPHEPLPDGLNRGFGGPQLYLALERTMAIAARRLGIDPAELRRRNLVATDEFPYRTPSRRRSTTPATTRAASTTRSRSSRYDERRAERGGARGRPARRHRDRLRRRAVDLEHGLHHARRDGRGAGAGAAEVRERRGRARSPSRRSAGSRVRIATTPQGQGHRTVAAQVVGRRARRRAGGHRRASPRSTRRPSPWTVASGNYSSRFSGVGVGAVRGQPPEHGSPQKIGRDPQTHARRRDRVSLRRLAGTAHWNPEALPDGMEPGLAATAFYAAPNLAPPDDERPRRLLRAHGFLADVAVVEVDRETGEVRCSTTSPCTTPAACSTRCSPTARCAAASRTASAPRSSSGIVYDEDGNLLTATFMDYLAPTAPDLPRRGSGTSSRRRRSRRSARRASARERR